MEGTEVAVEGTEVVEAGMEAAVVEVMAAGDGVPAAEGLGN